MIVISGGIGQMWPTPNNWEKGKKDVITYKKDFNNLS